LLRVKERDLREDETFELRTGILQILATKDIERSGYP